jgi:hypothetical protein
LGEKTGYGVAIVVAVMDYASNMAGKIVIQAGRSDASTANRFMRK